MWTHQGTATSAGSPAAMERGGGRGQEGLSWLGLTEQWRPGGQGQAAWRFQKWAEVDAKGQGRQGPCFGMACNHSIVHCSVCKNVNLGRLGIYNPACRSPIQLQFTENGGVENMPISMNLYGRLACGGASGGASGGAPLFSRLSNRIT